MDAAAHQHAFELPVHTERVRLFDDDAEPLMLGRRGGAVERAAAARRLAHVMIEPFSPSSVRVLLAGRLTLTGRHVRSDRYLPRTAPDMTLLSLHVERVDVGCPHRSGAHSRPRRQVPLDLYTLAEVDSFPVERHRLARHMNDHHEEAIRRMAAHATGVALCHVGAAMITRLDLAGATLTWISTACAHEVFVGFPTPATTIRELTAHVRTHFRASARTP
jgi:hypothetical protein